MLSSLVNQYLSIKTREELRARDPVCPRCESRPRHRTAIDERLTSYCTPCHQAIKKEMGNKYLLAVTYTKKEIK